MSRLKDHTYYSTTLSLCPKCRKTVSAKIILQNDRVYMQKFCPEHGNFKVLISKDQNMFLRERSLIRAGNIPSKYSSNVKEGCPFDCGMCPEHEQKCAICVIEITNHCNLDCNICFAYNNGNYHMTLDELGRCLDRIEECEGVDQVDMLVISGGEPTIHPEFYEIMKKCKERGFSRIVVNTNGIRLSEDTEMASFMAEHGIHVTLQFDTMKAEVYKKLRGSDLLSIKMKVIEMAERYKFNLNILQTVVKGVNDEEIGDVAKFALTKDVVRGLNIHLMTYTGKHGYSFPRDPLNSLTGDEVLDLMEKQTQGMLSKKDFIPMPFIHPRCALITYVIVSDGKIYPISRFMAQEVFMPLLEKGAIAKADQNFKEALDRTINDLWASDNPDKEEILKVLRNLFKKLYLEDRRLNDKDRAKIGESYIKTVFIHCYMDEATFDIDRLKRCCAMQVMPDGRMIPNCGYFVLHRLKDKRFFPE